MFLPPDSRCSSLLIVSRNMLYGNILYEHILYHLPREEKESRNQKIRKRGDLPKRLVVKGRFRMVFKKGELLEGNKFDLLRVELHRELNKVDLPDLIAISIPEMSQKLKIFKPKSGKP